LSARLFRDKQLRYAERELEMQRLLAGKGRRRKLRGVEKVEGDDEEEDDWEDEDALDARGGRSKASKGAPKEVDEKTWKPRVYKWRIERKR
jgi:U3 small nucleolar RNA-associated protein 11